MSIEYSPRRSALVTGGAGGLGAATARSLASVGYAVVVADRASTTATDLVHELGPTARFVDCDVTDEHSAARAVAGAVDAGPLRVVVCCAGVPSAERILGRKGPHQLDSFEHVLRVNLTGVFNVVRLAAAAMADNEPVDDERGVCILTSSIAAFEGQGGQVAYSASKAGILGMLVPIARDLARYGIRCNAIAPGTFDTAMVGGLSPDVQEALDRNAVWPTRAGRPSEFAGLVMAIVANQMLNGEVIRLDGAVRLPSL